jgi:hypothetical protein
LNQARKCCSCSKNVPEETPPPTFHSVGGASIGRQRDRAAAFDNNRKKLIRVRHFFLRL